MKTSKAQTKLIEAQASVLHALTRGELDPFALARFRKARRRVLPIDLMRCDERFRKHRFMLRRSSWLVRFCGRKASLDDLLTGDPDLVRAAIHSSDGFLREKAVKSLAKQELTALDLTALLCRCNDHVAEVRTVALARWNEACYLPMSSQLQAVLPLLLDRVSNWERGGQKALESVQRRPDYRRLLETMFLTETSGPLARQLKSVLRSDVLDASLGLLATDAKSAIVRGVATAVVLNGKSSYRTGMRWQWTDKSLGERRRVPVWETRQIEVPNDTQVQVLKTAARDPSAGVRKLALDRLITVGPLGFEHELDLLRNDKSHPIKWRMAYFESKWSGENSDKKE